MTCNQVRLQTHLAVGIFVGVLAGHIIMVKLLMVLLGPAVAKWGSGVVTTLVRHPRLSLFVPLARYGAVAGGKAARQNGNHQPARDILGHVHLPFNPFARRKRLAADGVFDLPAEPANNRVLLLQEFADFAAGTAVPGRAPKNMTRSGISSSRAMHY
jgi:hypothetical protein